MNISFIPFTKVFGGLEPFFKKVPSRVRGGSPAKAAALQETLQRARKKKQPLRIASFCNRDYSSP